MTGLLSQEDIQNSLLGKNLRIEVKVQLFWHKNMSYSRVGFFLRKKMCFFKGK